MSWENETDHLDFDDHLHDPRRGQIPGVTIFFFAEDEGVSGGRLRGRGGPGRGQGRKPGTGQERYQKVIVNPSGEIERRHDSKIYQQTKNKEKREVLAREGKLPKRGAPKRDRSVYSQTKGARYQRRRKGVAGEPPAKQYTKRSPWWNRNK